MRTWTSALTMAGLLSCGGPSPGGASSFGHGSGPGGPPGSTGAGSTTTTSAGAGSSTGPVAEDSSTGTGTTAGLLRDVGGVDFGGQPHPEGCKGKIDFLFVISREFQMNLMQARLIDAFPQFIATIESKFADFDAHIMVVDGDSEWGQEHCTNDCPVLDCTVGEPCCPWTGVFCEECPKPGDPCCAVDDYPCDALDMLTACDSTMGAGVTFPAGSLATNAPCPIAGGRRYLTGDQPDLTGTFACLAQVGNWGDTLLGEAMTAAVSPQLNGPGGCNEGFLRDDALLMVTFIYNTADTLSAGKPKLWAEAALAAKHGDHDAVMMFGLGRPDCQPEDRICDLVRWYFPHWYMADYKDPDYGPAFDIATDRVVDACAQFIPQ